MNYSKQRELILDTLAKHPVHPTADVLFEILKREKNDSNIGIATVYRNLKQLADKKIIKKISGLDNSEHFDSNTQEHYHFICTKCKRIFDLDKNIAPDISEKIKKNTGFIVQSHDIVVHGICRECSGEL